MTIQVIGQLQLPLTAPSANTKLRFTSTDTNDASILNAIEVAITEEDGSYNFELNLGSFLIEVMYENQWQILAHVLVDETVASPITLNELIRVASIVSPQSPIGQSPWIVVINRGHLDVTTGVLPNIPVYPTRMSERWQAVGTGTLQGDSYSISVENGDFIYWAVDYQQWQKEGSTPTPLSGMYTILGVSEGATSLGDIGTTNVPTNSTVTSAIVALDSAIESNQQMLVNELNTVTGNIIPGLDADITQVESDVADIDTTLATLQAEVDATNTALSATNQQVFSNQDGVATNTNSINSLTSRTNSIESSLSTLNTELTGITNQVAGVETELGSIRDDLSVLTTDLNGLSTSLTSVTSEVNTNSTEIDEVKSQVLTNVNNIILNKNSITLLTNDVAILSNAADGLAAGLSDTNSEIATLENILSTLSTQVLGIEADLNQTTNNVTTNANAISQLANDIDAFGIDIFNMQTKVDSFANEVTRIDTELLGVNNRVTSLEQSVQTEVTSLQNAISNVQTQVTQNHNDITVLGSHITDIESDIITINNEINTLTQNLTNVANSLTTLSAAAVRKFVTQVTTGGSGAFTVVHSLNTEDVQVMVYEQTIDGWDSTYSVNAVVLSTSEIDFNGMPNKTYKVVITG